MEIETEWEVPMMSVKTNDGVTLRFLDTGAWEALDREKPWLIFIHGFTGSSLVWQRNVQAFTPSYRVIVPDLRGHGSSDKPAHGYHVSRLAMDLRELMLHLDPTGQNKWLAVGGSLGCSILWAYASLFTTNPFTHTVFVDQSPLQDASPSSGWDHRFCNRGMNSPLALAGLQTTLSLSPQTAHLGTIAACLSYRAFPLADPKIGHEPPLNSRVWKDDEKFFLEEAMKGNPLWLGRLMGDHTALDWRDSISATFGPDSGSMTKVLVVASQRSGCFPAAGPLYVREMVNGGGEGEGEGRAKGVVITWGGHWCYWEKPEKFNHLVLKWLESGDLIDI